MKRIYVPTSGADDWRKLLADPQKHWRMGFSARALAHAWESASGFPPEIHNLILNCEHPFTGLELLLAIPEHQVPMPPHAGHPSQNDLFVLAKDAQDSLIAITVEGKVSESFDKSLSEWNAAGSPGKRQRLAYIQETLGLSGQLPPEIRYQLLHRTASAVLEARRFTARRAVMIVHSFNQTDLWHADYQAFLSLFGVTDAPIGRLHYLAEVQGIKIYSGWARGSNVYLQM